MLIKLIVYATEPTLIYSCVTELIAIDKKLDDFFFIVSDSTLSFERILHSLSLYHKMFS